MALFKRRKPTWRISSPVDYAGSRKSLTAAGQRVGKKEAEEARRLIQPWQGRAFSYYHQLGEIHYAAQFYARALSSLELYAGEWKEAKDGKKTLEPTDDERAVALLDRIQDPGGGRSSLLGSYGRLMFLPGEAFLLCTVDEKTDEERWEMLSNNELRLQGTSTYVRYKAPQLQPEEYREPDDDDFEPLKGKDAVVYRLWKRDPEFSFLADSPMQAVLDICEELLILTRAVRARAKSRLAGPGLLFVDDKIMPPPLEVVGDENPQEDPLFEKMIEAIITAIGDEGSPAAVSPIIVRVPVPDEKKLSEMIYHLQILDPMQLYPETGLRRECIERLAIGLDMPPEILTGLASATHWTAWAVDEQTWKEHLQPVAQQLVDDLTAAYFRPALRAEGEKDPGRFAIGYDATAIINHPDRAKDAKDLHDRGSLGGKALRDATGFEDSDAMTSEELQIWLSVHSRDPGFAVTGVPSKSTESGAAAEEKAGDTVDAGLSPAEVEKGTPPKPTVDDEVLPETVLGSNGHLADRVMVASDLALLRARELAGNRLLGLAKRDPDVLATLKDVRTVDVAATLGLEGAKKLKAPPARELVAGSCELIRDALRVWRVDAAVIDRLAAQIEQHAARTLYEKRPAPFPATFRNFAASVKAE